VAESCGVTFGLSTAQFSLAMVELGLVGEFANLDTPDQERAKQKSKDLYLGTTFILMSDWRRTTPLIDHLRNQYLEKSMGCSNIESWPKSLVDGYHRLLNWRGLTKPRPTMSSTGRVAFTTTTSEEIDESNKGDKGAVHTTRGKPKKDKSHIMCWNCKEMGHYSNKCPLKKKDEDGKKEIDVEETKGEEPEQQGVVQLTTGEREFDTAEITELDFGSGFMFMSIRARSETDSPKVVNGTMNSKIVLAASNNKLPEHYILLDNQANLPVFYNEKLLTRTWQVKTTMRINSEGGVSETNWKGWFPGYGEVWLHRDGIANILGQKIIPTSMNVFLIFGRFLAYLLNINSQDVLVDISVRALMVQR